MKVESGQTNKQMPFIALDAEDGETPLTGLVSANFTVYRTRNGGTRTAYTTPTITEKANGGYWLLIDEDTTLDSGADTQESLIEIIHAGMRTVYRSIEIYRPKATLGETLTASSGNVSLAAADLRSAVGLSAADLEDQLDALATQVSVVNAAVGEVKADTTATLVDTAVLGAPVGASLSADIAATKAAAEAAATSSNVTADRVAKQQTFYVGSEGNAARNIVTLNDWSSGTRALAFDFSELLDQADTRINSVSAVTVVQSDGSPSITTSNLRKHQNGRVAIWDTAAISSANAGTYVVTVTITTLDSNTIVVTGTLEVE